MGLKASRAARTAHAAALIAVAAAWAQPAGAQTGGPPVTEKAEPRCGPYCMSFFVRARSAKVVGKGHLSLAIKTQFIDYQEKRIDGEYESLRGADEYRVIKGVFTAKYGLTESLHLALGMPYIWNDFRAGNQVLDNNGTANAFTFLKWNAITESEARPAVSFDLWYYAPTGESVKKQGSSEDFWRVTTEISKSWPGFCLALNPGYVFSPDRRTDQVHMDAAALLTVHRKLWPAIEFNYTYKETKGKQLDLVPGVIWKFAKGWSAKAAAVINLESTMPYREKVGVVFKLFRRF